MDVQVSFEIESGTAAFQDGAGPGEVARLLRMVANAAESCPAPGGAGGDLRDMNDSRVGAWSVSFEAGAEDVPMLWSVFDGSGDRVAGPFSDLDDARRECDGLLEGDAQDLAEDYGGALESHLDTLRINGAYYVRRCDEDGREIRGQA